MKDSNFTISFAKTFFARGASAVGSLLFAFVAARETGAATFGQLALFISLAGITSIFARSGLDTALIRLAAEVKSSDNAGNSLSYFLEAIKRVMAPAFVFSILGAALLYLQIFGDGIPQSYRVFLLVLPLQSGLALVSGYLKGIGKSWLAPMFEVGGVSIVAAVFILALGWYGFVISGLVVLVCLATAMIALSLLSVRILFRERRKLAGVNLSNHEVAMRSPWRGRWHFMLIALAAYLLQAGSFVVAAPFLSNSQLGLVRAAERLAIIVSFPTLAINPYIASKLVHSVVGGKPSSIRATIVWAVVVGGALGVIPLIVFLCFPYVPLRAFGQGFHLAAPYLRLMAIANFAQVLLGSGDMAMNMGGLEKRAGKINVAWLISGIFLFATSSSLWGASGFVCSYVIVTSGRSISVFWASRQLWAEVK